MIRWLTSLVLIAGLLPAATPPGSQRPRELDGVGLVQRMNEQVPLDAQLRDETGRTVTLGQFFHGKPVLLALVYYRCPMLCSMELNGLVKALRALSFTAGQEFEIVTISFDPQDTASTAAEKKASYLQIYQRESAKQGWHFLTGDEQQVRRVADAVGFQYRYDERSQQYSHPAATTILTPQGRVARYMFGIEYSARELRLGLVEAAAGKIGTAIDRVILFCYHYDPATGKYTIAIMRTLRWAGVLTVLGIIGLVVMLVRRYPATVPEVKRYAS